MLVTKSKALHHAVSLTVHSNIVNALMLVFTGLVFCNVCTLPLDAKYVI